MTIHYGVFIKFRYLTAVWFTQQHASTCGNWMARFFFSLPTFGNFGISYNKLQDRQCTCNVTLRHVHESLLPWKSIKYYIFLRVRARTCMWVPGRVGVSMRGRACSLANPARNAYAPCFDVICGPSVSIIIFDLIS